MKPSATIDVVLTRPATPYSRNIFGHFIEHFHRQVYGGLYDPGSRLSNGDGFREDVIDAMRELAPPVVRWPGGCFVSSYHWLDGVGPTRTPHYDKAWRVTDPNTFGTREFVRWCGAIGADPYICLNAGTGTAEEMSDWVEYCNLPGGASRWSNLRAEHGNVAPFAVPFWSIGNENYGSWEIGAKQAPEWAALVRETAKMIRRVDESAHLITAARADLDWTLPLLAAAGPYLDAVAVHGYWDGLAEQDHPSDYLTAVGQSLKPQQDIVRTESIIEAAGFAGKISIAFDEWNLRGWHHPSGTSSEAIAARDRNDDNSTYTMADALFTASFLNTCLRKADVVSMANIAPSINTRGPLFVHADGVVRRTTFHVFALYAKLLGERVLHSVGSGAQLAGAEVPVVDQLATIDAAGTKISLALINRDPADAVDCDVQIAGRPITGRLPATVLTGPSPDSSNEIGSTPVAPVETKIQFTDGRTSLPPHSLTICHLDLPLAYNAGTIDRVPDRTGPWTLTDGGWNSFPESQRR
ncbi:alpha-L-arabinofuranosidase C-terminal domain-containing protein [Microlunatus parietis]|uniref:non-reducing end alpha-L-arabinofuranosidase n=1 Tax=Microlunatus parietis TaxID=682979 RepID=A0A7Y9IA28_9ACTN|nr:alpha-L-arabinofuranosidase C-terminal domain-containing protein [Microlunatus parietis]NYE72987.1 alpha-N-arabinofuranosidase [Microlunatus parietis]